MRKFVLLIFGFTLYMGQAFSQSEISFVEEYIDFTLSKDTFSINGLYYFENVSETPKSLGICFPFQTNTDSIYSIRVFDVYANKELKFRKEGKNIYFTVYVPKASMIPINIHYKQQTKDKNSYVLLSTKAWEKPLRKAVYSLNVEETIKVKAFSYPADSISGNMYYWGKEDFMPDKDFEVDIINR